MSPRDPRTLARENRERLTADLQLEFGVILQSIHQSNISLFALWNGGSQRHDGYIDFRVACEGREELFCRHLIPERTEMISGRPIQALSEPDRPCCLAIQEVHLCR